MKKKFITAASLFAAACIFLASCTGGENTTDPASPDGASSTAQNALTQADGNLPSVTETDGSGSNGSGSNTDGTSDALVSLVQNTVDVLAVKTYSGRFIENGTVESVQNVLAVTLKNKGTEDFELLDFEVSDGEHTYSFSAATLLSGATLTVLEKNGTTVADGFTAKSVRVTRAAYFSAKPSMNGDRLSLDCSKGVINVKNISDTDISDGYIYYKEYRNGGYFGGITYRIKTGEIKAGETKQLSATGFDPEIHRTVFTTYVG